MAKSICAKQAFSDRHPLCCARFGVGKAVRNEVLTALAVVAHETIWMRSKIQCERLQVIKGRKEGCDSNDGQKGM